MQYLTEMYKYLLKDSKSYLCQQRRDTARIKADPFASYSENSKVQQSRPYHVDVIDNDFHNGI